MRKIISIKEREKKEKRNRIIVGLILVGIMVLSTAGYAFYQTGRESVEKINYKGIEFVLKEDGLWHFLVQEQEFFTFNNAKDAENVFIFDNLNLQGFVGKNLYFSYDSDKEAVNEIVRNIGGFFTRIQLVCMEKCEEDLPVKNCSDSIIIIKEGNETLIKQEENCVYIQGKKEELIKASDAFIFKSLGI